jgi:HEAT repeat protein
MFRRCQGLRQQKGNLTTVCAGRSSDFFMKTFAGCASVTLSILFTAAASIAQSPPASPARTPQKQRIAADPTEAILLTNGWALLSQGLVDDAYRKANEVLIRYPRSAAALSLGVEAAIARGGASNGIAQYEQWLGSRSFEEPSVLRRLASAVLHEAANRPSDALVRLEALRALAADGQQAALAALEASAVPANTRTLAALGNPDAVRELSGQLAAGNPDKARIVEALGGSGRRSAVPAVAAQAADSHDEVRAAVADALAELHAEDRISVLKSLLTDSSAFVRLHASRALFRLGDMSGLPLLQELAAGEASSGRLAAAEAMSTSPDASWLALVRDLTSSSEPEVRVHAARLIAAQDPDLARRVLDAASADANIAIREMATRALPGVLSATDLGVLRQLLHQTDALSRVQAAARILALTR